MRGKTKEKRRPSEKKSKFLFPLSRFCIEIYPLGRQRSVLIGGTLGIEEFGEEEVILRTDAGRILLAGRALSIAVFEGGRTEIVGDISAVRFI